jgi:succinoglycan biosynthesis transport protein ExoP
VNGSVDTTDEHPGVLASMWDYRVMCAAIVVLVVAVSVSAGLLVQPRAQAKATILLSPPAANSVLAPDLQGDASMARYTAQRAAFVMTDNTLNAVADKLAGKVPGKPAKKARKSVTTLRHDISASPSSSSNAIVILAKGDGDAKAVQLASAVVAAYREQTENEVHDLTASAAQSINRSELAVRSDAAADPTVPQTFLANTLSQLAVQASQIRTSSALFGDGVESVSAARVDAVTSPSLPIREAALGLVLGLAIAATVAWIRADQDDLDEQDAHDDYAQRL